MAGPEVVPAMRNPTAVPLCLYVGVQYVPWQGATEADVLTASKVSATRAWPATRKKQDSKPDRILIVTKVAIVLDKAAPIENKAKVIAAIKYETFRPMSYGISMIACFPGTEWRHTLLRGFHRNDENAIARIRPALA